jgi:hypothetical protein
LVQLNWWMCCVLCEIFKETTKKISTKSVHHKNQEKQIPMSPHC